MLPSGSTTGSNPSTFVVHRPPHSDAAILGISSGPGWNTGHARAGSFRQPSSSRSHRSRISSSSGRKCASDRASARRRPSAGTLCMGSKAMPEVRLKARATAAPAQRPGATCRVKSSIARCTADGATAAWARPRAPRRLGRDQPKTIHKLFKLSYKLFKLPQTFQVAKLPQTFQVVCGQTAARKWRLSLFIVVGTTEHSTTPLGRTNDGVRRRRQS